MNTILNILWLIFGGFISALGFFVAGCLLCITIVGIPFGLQAFRMAGAVAMPFGTEIVSTEKDRSTGGLVMDIIWLLVVGWELALAHLVAAAGLAVTIIGLPFAWQHIKLIPVALFPFGYDLQES